MEGETNGREEVSLPTATAPLGVDGVQKVDSGRYNRNYGAHRVGISGNDVVSYYDDWADAYDQDLCPDCYKGPSITAREVASLSPDGGAVVLDVAAGTGFLGEKLKDLGFKHVDGLEPAAAMLEKARSKGVYRKYICSSLGSDKLDIPNDEYDVLAVTGGMGEGHIPCVGLTEMIRVVKPGGHVVIVMREEYLGYVTEYVDRLEPYMAELVAAGRWRLVRRTVVPNYSFNKNGVAFVYEVLQAGFEPHTSTVIQA